MVWHVFRVARPLIMDQSRGVATAFHRVCAWLREARLPGDVGLVLRGEQAGRAGTAALTPEVAPKVGRGPRHVVVMGRLWPKKSIGARCTYQVRRRAAAKSVPSSQRRHGVGGWWSDGVGGRAVAAPRAGARRAGRSSPHSCVAGGRHGGQTDRKGAAVEERRALKQTYGRAGFVCRCARRVCTTVCTT
eukprot:gene1614-biopygen2239